MKQTIRQSDGSEYVCRGSVQTDPGGAFLRNQRVLILGRVAQFGQTPTQQLIFREVQSCREN